MNFVISISISLLFSFMPLLKINYKSKNFIKDNYYYILCFILLFIGSFIRIIYIDKIPYGLNQDEASIGYEAYSLLNNGIDRVGNSYPVNFVSWGNGQNVLYAYLSIPFIKLLGLNVLSTRILMSIIGCLTLLVVYLFTNKYFNKKYSLISLFIIVIMPWHIMKSRWALESNLFPDLLLYSLILIYLGVKKKKNIYYVLSSIVLGISIYSYGTSYVYVPLLMFSIYLYLIKKKKVSIKQSILYIFLTAFISFPMILYVIDNFFLSDSLHIFNITIPKLLQNKLSNDTILSGNFILNIIKYIYVLIGIIITEHDVTTLNNINYFGIYYYFSIVFIVVGIRYCFRNKNIYLKIVNISFIVGFITSLFIFPNINRANTIWFPLIIYIIIGLCVISKKYLKYILLLYFISFSCFIVYYFGSYNNDIKNYTNYSLNDCLKYVKDKEYNHLFITNRINQPFIFYLFYNKIDSNYYVNNVVIDKRYELISVSSLDNVYFYYPNVINNGDIVIVDNIDIDKFSGYKALKEFKYYSVLLY